MAHLNGMWSVYGRTQQSALLRVKYKTMNAEETSVKDAQLDTFLSTILSVVAHFPLTTTH